MYILINKVGLIGNEWSDDDLEHVMIKYDLILEIGVPLKDIIVTAHVGNNPYYYQLKVKNELGDLRNAALKPDQIKLHAVVKNDKTGDYELKPYESKSSYFTRFTLNSSSVISFILSGLVKESITIEKEITRSKIIKYVRKNVELRKLYRYEHNQIDKHVKDASLNFTVSKEGCNYSLNLLPYVDSLSSSIYTIRPVLLLPQDRYTVFSEVRIEKNRTTCGVNLVSLTDGMFSEIESYRKHSPVLYDLLLKAYHKIFTKATSVKTLMMSTCESTVRDYAQAYADFVKLFDSKMEVASLNPNSGNKIITTILITK